MESADTDLKKTFDIKQMALIGKMHNMQWLKSNTKLSGHTKTSPDGKEIINNTLINKINEGTTEETEVASTNTLSNSSELNKIDSILNKDINENDNTVNKDTLQSPLEIVDFSQKDMETVWNKDVNVTSTMFPNSQSLVMQRLDEQEVISMSLAENIVTVQLEQFRLNEEENNKSDQLNNEADNEWDNSQHNMPDLSKSDNEVGDQVSSKQCHDNNNNNERSKSQSPLETKQNIQETTTKISTKKLSDQKIKKQAGSSLKESWIPSKQGSKSKDNLLNLHNDNVTSTSTDSKKVVIGSTPKLIDKYSKVNSYNKNLIMGKGARMKEQQFFKQHFSTLNDSGNRSRSSLEGLDEKSKPVATKLKPTRNESDKKSSEVDDIKKCHKVQVTRTQSYNVQYNRNKPLIKSQQRYSRNTAKPEENGSINNSSGFNHSSHVSNTTENVLRKKCENQQSLINKPISNTPSNQSTSGKNTKSSSIPDCSISERSSIKSNSVPCKRNYQNLSNTKNSSEKNIKDDQTYTQKFKKDSNVYRRSTGILQTYSKDLNGKAKTDDHKRNITENNLKDYRVNRISSVDTKIRSQSEGSSITVYSHKTSNGASNIKTDTLDSIAVNNVQSAKSSNSFSNSTKDCTTMNTSTHMSQESQVLQASCNETEVQFVKTESEDTSNNNSNNKTSTSNSETKSVKFLDNIQEFTMAHHSATSYNSDNSMHQSKLPANSFFSDMQSASNINSAQQMENHQNVQSKNYFDNNNAQYDNTTTRNQNTERDLHLMDLMHQKPEQTSHISPQSILPPNSTNPAIAMGSGLHYQNMPAVYLNQYNNTQTVPRKTADSTIISQNALIPSTSSYTVESQNIMQTDPSNILMHGTQTSVLPPPGFHSHPITTHHNQWNMPLPTDMFLFGNMMNPAHSLNMPIQNSRHMCNTDFNNIQQTNYVQHPLFYVPPLCMQSWNPLLQYSAPLFQNPPYNNCSTFPNQVLSPNSLTDSMNCPVPTSMQSNLYKHFQQVQPLENTPSFSVPVKLDNYIGNMQGCKSNNIRMKDSTMDAHMRASQYRAPVPNEYHNSSQDNHLMVPYSYAVTMDSVARNGPSNMHMQVNHKYTPRALTANYPRIPESCSVFHSNQDSSNRKDDASKSDSECIPPMVSPRECMYYGVNYSRKTDTIQNSSMRSDVQPVPYMHSVNTQHYVPHFQKNTTYHGSSKELLSRVNMGHGTRKTMDQ